MINNIPMSHRSIAFFYTLMNEAGDDSAHPNALQVPVNGDKPTLGDVLAVWPFGKATFEFKTESSLVAIRDPADTIPAFNDTYFARVAVVEEICKHGL